MVGATGHDTRVTYLWEDNGYAASPTDTTNKTFGADVNFSRAEGSNDALRVFDPGEREASTIVPRGFSGSWGVEFTLTNPWWIRGVIDSATTAGTAAPYTHTFDGDVPDSMRIVVGLEKPGAQRILKGAVVRSATIDVRLNDTVKVSLDGFYADEEVVTSGAGVAQVLHSDEAMMFQDASLKIGTTTYSLVQNVSLSIENNVDPIGEIGTRLTVDYAPKVRAPNVSFTKVEEADTTLEQRLYGGATSVQQDVANQKALNFKFDNGKAGASKQTVDFQVSGTFPDSLGMSGIGDPEAVLQQNINEAAEGIKVVAENDSATAQ